MSNQTLNKYLFKLTHLNRANTIYGKAPHKPVLLISIIELIGKGLVSDNRFYIDTDLVAAFQENWRLLVDTLHQSDFTQPFFYLQSEKVQGEQLWHLQAKFGCQINAHIKSISRLREVLDFGYFEKSLYSLLTNPHDRNVIKTVLLETYFPTTSSHFKQSKLKGEGYIQELQKYILNEPEARYKTPSIDTEEDIFVRGGLFKKLVPKVYNSTCSFTGMRLESTFAHSFIDACHIVPFSLTHDDTITNGIALCPNLHRAFDRGLVSVDNDYRIIISKHISEIENHTYSLKLLTDRKIRLPLDTQYFPSLENLKWHREQIFK